MSMWHIITIKIVTLMSRISVSSDNWPVYAVHPHFKSAVQLVAVGASDSVIIDHTLTYKCSL